MNAARRTFTHLWLPFLLWSVLFIALPVGAQTSAVNPEAGPDYVTGQVIEILSEKTIVDEAFGHQEKKFKFKVRFPGKSGQPEETVTVEQAYTPQTAKELLPTKGKKYIFFQDQGIDGSRSYTLVDVQRSGHLGWTALLMALMLIGIARWYGLKPLLISTAMGATFYICHFLHLPWFLISLLTLAATVSASALLNFGLTRRMSVSLAASGASLLATLLLIWLGSWFSLADFNTLLGGSLILQLSAGLAYIANTTVSGVYLHYRNDPTLTAQALLQKSVFSGRGSVEVVASLYLLIFLSQVLTATFGQNEAPGLMQMEPILAEMVGLFFMLMGLALSLPISAWLGIRMIYRRRV
ncbi:MAG: hypothetical protein AB7I41_21395 [Candidatus Sericytochromatia bacterium]